MRRYRFIEQVSRCFHKILQLCHRINVRIKLRITYHNEILLLEGRHKTDNTRKSIVFFTVPKAASHFVGNIMKRLTKDAGMVPVDLESYFWSSMIPEDYGKIAKQVFKPFGYFYGPFWSFNKAISNLNEYQILLVLRDPRDAIVSKYYSILYSHPLPMAANRKYIKATMLKREEDRLKQKLDDYVINFVNSDYLEKYYLYYRELMGKPNVLFLKYEYMVNDFKAWLENIIGFFHLHASQKTINGMIKSVNFKVVENIYRHKRQVIPGDHRRKLKRETIDELNRKCKKMLRMLDYAI